MPSEDKSIISNRKLAAILFADIVGYTSLMQEGEGNAMSILDRFEEITKQKVGKYSGEIIKSYGDGSLILFDSTIDAAKCAVEMQMEFRSDPEVPLRIGIHIGEIVRKGSDVFGNGVNIASRIESMGVKGAVLLSKNARDKIKNQEILETLSLGTFDFKNVEEPIEVFALTNDGLNVPNKKHIKGKFKSHQKSPRKLIGALTAIVLLAISLVLYNSIFQKQDLDSNQNFQPPKKSIAVLPLKNLSGDQKLEYVCDGMTDAIITRLNQIKDINRVSSFTSVLKYKVKNLSAPEIATELGVANILQGSFQKSGNQIKISLQLIDGISDKQIWSHLYSGEWAPNDIFSIQAEVTKNVAEKIDSDITELERVKIQKIPTENKEAYNLFLQAEHERYKSNQSAFTNAISLYEKSIELDPNFSEAYVGIGKIWSTSGLVWGIYKEEEAWSKAKFYLTKALQLDSTNLDLQNELFGSMFYYEWNFDY